MTTTLESVCPLDCPDTCSLSVEVDDGRVVAVDGSRRNPYTDGFICAKVRRYPERLYSPRRILEPMRRRGPKGAGQFVPISWDEALAELSGRLRATLERSGGAAILPYHYGGSNGLFSEEGADARFFHRLGACILDKTICAAPTGIASRAMYGTMSGVPADDYPLARLILLWGVNPAATSIHLFRHLHRAKQAGATIVVIDPVRSKTARLADLHLRPRPGTDVVVALGLAQRLREIGAWDEAFLAQYADGVEAVRSAAAEYSLARVEAESGVPAAQLDELARRYAEASPAVLRCGWGVERNRNGGNAVRAILSLPALAGKFGVRGGGFTMSMSRGFRLDPTALARPDLRREPARHVNMTRLGRALTELRDPPIEVLFVYNANPVAMTPDQNRILAGLRRDDLYTVVHEQVMTDTARWADLVLPATTIFEQNELHKSYGHHVLQYSEAVIPPVGAALSNVELFRRLSQALGFDDAALYDENDLMRSALGPDGAAVASRVRRDRAVAMTFDGREELVQFGTDFPTTAGRRVQLAPPALGEFRYRPEAPSAYPLILLTPASDKLVNSTFGESHLPDPRLKVHPDDAVARGLADGDVARIYNDLGEVHLPVRLSADALPGVVSMPKGLWCDATRNGSTSTALIADDLTDIGDGACFNDARVEIERLDSRSS